MTIVLNEHEWAKDMIKARSLGKKPVETLRRVARYYIDNNFSKKEVRKMLDIFLLQCNPTASLPKWSNTLDSVLARAMKCSAIEIDGIDISKPEMEKIDALPGRQIRRLAFTLLCLAKYWDIVNPHGDHWVNSKDIEIMRMANINTSVKRQSALYHDLQDMGFVQFSKKVDNTNVRVLFMEEGDPALTITDFRNLGNQYCMYHGEPFYECQNCGVVTKIEHPGAGNNIKYCKACASEVAARQRANLYSKARIERYIVS